MVIKRKRAFHKKRTGMKKIKKEVSQLRRGILPGFRCNVEYVVATTAAFPSVYVGSANNTPMDSLCFSRVLTSLAVGATAVNGQRTGPFVQYERLVGTIIFQMNIQAAVLNYKNYLRVIIVNIKQMPGISASHTHPTPFDIFQTQNAVGGLITEADMMAPLSWEHLGRDGNYRIVYDKIAEVNALYAYNMVRAAHGGRSKKIDHPPQHVGWGTDFYFTFDLNLKKEPQTTYDGTTNTVASCCNNHYVLYAMLAYDVAGTGGGNNVPSIDYNARSYYRSL